MVIRNQDQTSKTEISNVFIDEYMTEANGEFVKVYLYLLRLSQAPGTDVSVAALADQLNDTENDVLRALKYWERQGLLRRDGEELRILPVEEARAKSGEIPAEGTGRGEPDASAAGPEQTAVRLAGRDGQSVGTVSQSSMDRLQEDENFRQILFVAETYLGRTLSPKDVQLFAYLYDELHFPEDLLEYLVEYCVGGGHRSYRYMETVALNWHAEGKMTVQQARESQRNYSRANRQVMKAFGIAGRVLSMKEQEFVQKWLGEYAMPLPVIVEACGCTMTAIHEPSFEYTDTILKEWSGAGVRTVEEARARRQTRKTGRRRAPAENPAKNRFQNYEQRKIDYDELLTRNGINLYSNEEA